MHEWKWNWLWWKLEDWETPEECIIREMEEESGFNIKNPKLKWILTFPAFDWIDTWYVYVFVANEFSWEMLEDSPEWLLEWINDNKIIDLNLWEWDKIFMKWMEENKFFSGKFIYDKGKLKEYSVNFY